MINVDIEFKWKECNPDLSVCSNCEETIYSKMYIGYVDSPDIKITKNIDIKICQSCYNELIKF